MALLLALLGSCVKLDGGECWRDNMQCVRALSRVSSLPGSGTGSNFRFNLFFCSISSKKNKTMDEGLLGDLCHAHDMFDEISRENISTYISALYFHFKVGEESKAFSLFSSLRRHGLKPDGEMLSSFVSICSRANRIKHGVAFHSFIVKLGFHDHDCIARDMAVMYSKCGKIASTLQLLKERSTRGSIMCNSLISLYLHNNMNIEAIYLFSRILGRSSEDLNLVNNFIFSSIFKACAQLRSIEIGRIVHGLALKLCLKWDVVMAGSLMDTYSKQGCLEKAFRIFEDLRDRDIVVWNAIISGCVQNSRGKEAMSLFQEMQAQGFCPNEVTFSIILKASSEIEDIDLGRCFHSSAIKYGYLSDSFVGTSLVAMYSKCMQIEAAESAFMAMEHKNLVTFNALISGLALVCSFKKAMKAYILLLDQEIEPDPLTLTSVISSCSSNALFEGFQVHCHAIKLGIDSHVSLGNSLVGFYAKCGIINSSLKAFGSIIEPNAVSWAGVISCLVKNDEGEKAMHYFKTMVLSRQMPDEFSTSAVLKVASGWSNVGQGMHLHGLTIKLGLESAIFVATGLVDMYCKSGFIDYALKMFDSAPVRNDAMWNVMINGLGHNGCCDSSLALFHKMLDFGVMPNALTFNAVLSACNHAGLVNKGSFYFNLMCSWYGISPSIEHCTCMISLLVRSGFLQEAELLSKAHSFVADPLVGRSLIGSCQVPRSKAGELTFDIGSSIYVLLSNLFSGEEFQTNVADMRGLMREMGINKELGCSWISVRDETHVFAAGHKLCIPDLMHTMLFLVHRDIIASF